MSTIDWYINEKNNLRDCGKWFIKINNFSSTHPAIIESTKRAGK
jgi:hypothetical protein